MFSGSFFIFLFLLIYSFSHFYNNKDRNYTDITSETSYTNYETRKLVALTYKQQESKIQTLYNAMTVSKMYLKYRLSFWYWGEDWWFESWSWRNDEQFDCINLYLSISSIDCWCANNQPRIFVLNLLYFNVRVAARLFNFWTFRLGADSRWALIRDWALTKFSIFSAAQFQPVYFSWTKQKKRTLL